MTRTLSTGAGLACVICMTAAAQQTNRFPINRGILQSDADGNHNSITNLNQIVATNYIDATTGLPIKFSGNPNQFGTDPGNHIIIKAGSTQTNNIFYGAAGGIAFQIDPFGVVYIPAAFNGSRITLTNGNGNGTISLDPSVGTVIATNFNTLAGGAFTGNGSGITNVPPTSITGTNWIGINSGRGTNLTTFGSTNYFANDLAANTNGPLYLYRTAGSANLSNLVMDVTLGTVSRFSIVASSSPADQGYGGFTWLLDHDVPGTINGTLNEEFSMVSPRHIGIVPGSGNGQAGHVQLGNVNGFGGYALNNQWWYFTSQLNLFTTPTNFSAALCFNTSELQGAVISNHYPAILAYSIQTNTPGRYALLFAQEIDQQRSSPFDTWDPNRAKAAMAGWWMQMIGGDTNVVVIQSNLYVGGNLTMVGPTNWISGTFHGAQISADALTNGASAGSRIQITDANGKVKDAAASGAVPINADGTATTLSQSGAWGTSGNSGLGASKFLGTTDLYPVEFRINNTRVALFDNEVNPSVIVGNGVSGTGPNGITTNSTSGNAGIFAGFDNWMTNPASSVIIGGTANRVGDNNSYSGIFSSSSCLLSANGTWCTIFGSDTSAAGGVSVLKATVVGGLNNTNTGSYSIVLSGQKNLADHNYDFAAGRRSKSQHDGAFVWSDSTDADNVDVGQDTFNVRAKAHFLTNSASSGSYTAFTNGSWSVTGGSGGGFTNNNLTASRVILTDTGKGQISATASGAVPIDADGTATTGNQLRGFITNHIVGKSYALMAQNTTAFFAPQGNSVTNLHASDVDMQTRQAIGTGFQVVGIWIKSSQAAGAGQNYTITVMTNGVATALAPAISGASATTASQFTSIPIVEAQGDSIGIRVVTSATATTNTRFDWDVMFINQ